VILVSIAWAELLDQESFLCSPPPRAAAQVHNRAVEADMQAQILFRAQVALQYAGRNLIFIDESSFDKRTYARAYGRAKRGGRTNSKKVFVRGPRFSLLPVMSKAGVLDYKIYPGSIDATAFLDFVHMVLVPSLADVEAPVVILDNCRIHHIAAVREALEGAGIEMLFLPPYSPELNPIELLFSKTKSAFRRLSREVRESFDMPVQIGIAIESVTAQDCAGWYAHCSGAYR